MTYHTSYTCNCVQSVEEESCILSIYLLAPTLPTHTVEEESLPPFPPSFEMTRY